MSDRRTREQHHRKFQELINPKNQSKHFRSDTPNSRGGNNIPSSNKGEGNNIPSSRGRGNNISSSKSGGNDIPSNRGEGNNNTPISNNNTLSSGGKGNNNLLAAEAKAIKIPPAAEAKTTPTAKVTLFSAELEAKAILS